MNLTEKYNVPGPRYTSYPTVPFWDDDSFSSWRWVQHLGQASTNSGQQGISLYIHLPFCESLCTFCACTKHITRNHGVEQTYIGYLLKEWALVRRRLGRNPVIRELHLGGGTPTFFSPESLRDLLSGIFAEAVMPEQRSYSLEGHPNNTRRSHLHALAELGFDRVSFGVQDYDPVVQRAINRIQPFENVERVTLAAREAGFGSVTHDLVFGLPFQTLDGIGQTIDKTLRLRPDRIALYSYAHVPWIKGNGQRAYQESDLPEAPTKRLMYQNCRQQLLTAGYLDIGMDHFALPGDSLAQARQNGRLHRNFMGYTDSPTSMLVGLGMSAISDCGTAFAQNMKTVREYYQHLDRGELPILRGHILDEQDRVMRRHILDLMCRFASPWHPQDLPWRAHIKDNLAELERDGLVEVSNEKVTVTPQGQGFVRNICMAFDLRLERQTPGQKLFSMTV